jgi:hypothetical protein
MAGRLSHSARRRISPVPAPSAARENTSTAVARRSSRRPRPLSWAFHGRNIAPNDRIPSRSFVAYDELTGWCFRCASARTSQCMLPYAARKCQHLWLSWPLTLQLPPLARPHRLQILSYDRWLSGAFRWLAICGPAIYQLRVQMPE